MVYAAELVGRAEEGFSFTDFTFYDLFLLCVPQVDLQKETLINFLSLEVSFRAGLHPGRRRVNKRLRLGREQEVEKTGRRGQDPRQEEGIPSPSLQWA